MNDTDSDAARQVLFDNLPEIRQLLRDAGVREPDLELLSAPDGASSSDLHLLIKGTRDVASQLTKQIGYRNGLRQMRMTETYVGDEPTPRWLISTVMSSAWLDAQRLIEAFKDRLDAETNEEVVDANWKAYLSYLRSTPRDPNGEGTSHVFSRTDVQLICHVDAGSTPTATVRINSGDRSGLLDVMAAAATWGRSAPWYVNVETDEDANVTMLFAVANEQQGPAELMRWANALIAGLEQQGIDATIDYTQNVEALEVFAGPHPGAVQEEKDGAFIRRLRPQSHVGQPP